MDPEQRAKALFDAFPHNNKGRVPDWNIQPEHLKEIFRKFSQKDVHRHVPTGTVYIFDHRTGFCRIFDVDKIVSVVTGVIGGSLKQAWEVR